MVAQPTGISGKPSENAFGYFAPNANL